MTEPANLDVVELLKTSRAVQFGDFTLASGKRSDFYVNVKRASLTSWGMDLLARSLTRLLFQSDFHVDAIGGPELGAVPLVGGVLAHIATSRAPHPAQEHLDIRGFIIRKEPKSHGASAGQLIEGDLPPGCACVLIEDVLTSGQSALRGVQILREHGQRPWLVLAVVDRQEGAVELLARHGVPAQALVTRAMLLGARDAQTETNTSLEGLARGPGPVATDP